MTYQRTPGGGGAGLANIVDDSTKQTFSPGAAGEAFRINSAATSGLPGTVGRDDTGNWTSINYSPYAFFYSTRRNYSASQDVVQVKAMTSGTKNVSTRTHGVNVNISDHPTAKNVTVTDATNASPIAVTATGHGWVTGTRVAVDSVGGNTAANGSWLITVVDANTFTLDGSTGNGAYTSGGLVTTRPMYYAFNATVTPIVDRGGLTGPNAFADDVNAYVAYNGGTARGTDAFYIGHNSTNFTGSDHEWITGYTCDASVQYGVFSYGGRLTGGASAEAAVFRAHKATIDVGGYVMTAPNNSLFSARNAAGSGFVDMFKVGPFDAVNLAPGGAPVAVGYTPSGATVAGVEVRPQTNIPGLRLRRQTGTTPANFIEFLTESGNASWFISGFGRSFMDPGSAAFPGYVFAGDGTTGFYRPAANQVGIATAGVARGAWSSNGLQVGSDSFALGGGAGVIGITNATTAPTTDPSGGVVLYAEGGALKVRGASGTVTILGPA